MVKIPISLLHSSIYLKPPNLTRLYPIFPIPFTIMMIMFSVLMSGGGGQGWAVPCTVRSNASWVVVTWGPPGQTDTTENIIFPQLRWREAINESKTTVHKTVTD